jgi:hypothetical protein
LATTTLAKKQKTWREENRMGKDVLIKNPNNRQKTRDVMSEKQHGERSPRQEKEKMANKTLTPESEQKQGRILNI